MAGRNPTAKGDEQFGEKTGAFGQRLEERLSPEALLLVGRIASGKTGTRDATRKALEAVNRVEEQIASAQRGEHN